jgi:hypothetical protein
MAVATLYAVYVLRCLVIVPASTPLVLRAPA